MLKNEMESYVITGERDLENLKYPYMGVGGGVKNCQNHPYVINERHLMSSGFETHGLVPCMGTRNWCDSRRGKKFRGMCCIGNYSAREGYRYRGNSDC